MPKHYGMDGEEIWPHWDCPDCDAPNAGVEQCNPALAVYQPVLCDECGAVMVYHPEWEEQCTESAQSRT